MIFLHCIAHYIRMLYELKGITEKPLSIDNTVS